MNIFFVVEVDKGWDLKGLSNNLPSAEPFTDNLRGVLIDSQWEEFDADTLYFCPFFGSGPSLFWSFNLSHVPQVGSTVSIPDIYWQGYSTCVVRGIHYNSSNCIIVDCSFLES